MRWYACLARGKGGGAGKRSGLTGRPRFIEIGCNIHG